VVIAWFSLAPNYLYVNQLKAMDHELAPAPSTASGRWEKSYVAAAESGLRRDICESEPNLQFAIRTLQFAMGDAGDCKLQNSNCKWRCRISAIFHNLLRQHSRCLHNRWWQKPIYSTTPLQIAN
jgi:hypothetical protein